MYNFTKNIFFKLVSIEDAKFVADIRSNKDLSKFLNPTKHSLNDQKKWIEDYKKREDEKKEFYFIIKIKPNVSLGTIRIYNIFNNIFTWGSWILIKDSPKYAALESALTLYSFAFDKMRFAKSIFDVKKENLKVIGIHKKLGAKITSEDNENVYFEFTLENFKHIKNKFIKFIK